MTEFSHLPVMPEEVIESLEVKPGGVYVDGTLGGGGHSELIAKMGGKLIGIDRDQEAITAASQRLSAYNPTIVNDNFNNINAILDKLGVDKIDGAILDLGMSSHQIDNKSRGFSYNHDAPLDMRMDRESTITAKDIVNRCSQEELTKILFHYGEETYTRKIVQRIMYAREQKPVETTTELAHLIKSAIPAWTKDPRVPVRRVFQAIRIAVNDELSGLGNALDDFCSRLKEGGRLAVITFHSLEDRIVKTKFANLATDCVCPPDFPVCNCDKEPQCIVITKKPILPSQAELSANTRAASAKLRVIEKI